MSTENSVVTSVRLTHGTKAKIDQLAAATGRSRAYLLAEAVERYVAYETWFVAQVEEALREEKERGHESDYYMTTDQVVVDLLKRTGTDSAQWSNAEQAPAG